MFDEEPDGDPHGECREAIHRLQAELAEIAAALPGPIYMDPPDGGSVTIAEQVARLVKDRNEANTLVFKLTKQLAEAIRFRDGMTPDDDRRFLEATNGLTANG